MATRAPHYYTPEEYLARDRADEYKNEYLDGVIYPMAQITAAHNILTGNIARHLMNCIEDRPYHVYACGMRIRVAATGLYTYPDVVAVSGPCEFEDDTLETLRNPSVIVEVLSPSSEGYDRGAKATHYWKIPSLTDYVLVTQNEMRVEHFTRHPDGLLMVAHTEPDAMLNLPVVESRIQIAKIYKKVDLPPPPKPGKLRTHRVQLWPTPGWPAR